MRVRNPAYVQPAQTFVNAKKGAVQQFIAGQSGEFITFDAIRAAFPAAERPALTDGVIVQILADLGHKVEA